MQNFRNTISVLALASVLVMGACSKKDKGATENNIFEAASLTGKGVDADKIRERLKVEPRKVEEAEAQEALEQLGLSTENSDGVTWDKQKGSKGRYTYDDVVVKTSSDGKTFFVDELELSGVRMVNDKASFDRLDLSGLKITDENSELKIESVSLARPSEEVAAKIVTVLENLEDFEKLTVEQIKDIIQPGDLGFGAILSENIQGQSDTAKVNIEAMGWGADAAGVRGDFLLDDVDITFLDSEGGSSQLEIEKVSTAGFKFKPDAVGIPFRELIVDDFNLKLSPSSFKDAIEPISMGGDYIEPAEEALSDMGYQVLEFTGQQIVKIDEATDQLTIKDSHIRLKDGFNLTYDYTASGVAAANELRNPSLDDLDVQSANLVFEDQSISEKFIDAYAKNMGVSPSMVRFQAKFLLAAGGMFGGGQDNSVIGDLTNVAGKFIDDGGTVKISLAPTAPVSGSELQNIMKHPRKIGDLGLKIEHQK